MAKIEFNGNREEINSNSDDVIICKRYGKYYMRTKNKPQPGPDYKQEYPELKDCSFIAAVHTPPPGYKGKKQ